MKDFWISCGHHLLERGEGGSPTVTNDFLKVYFARPELMSPQDACAVECSLYLVLLADPRMPVPAVDIAAIFDPDARENWQLTIEFRDRLVCPKALGATGSRVWNLEAVA
jgi:hypothetical protein